MSAILVTMATALPATDKRTASSKWASDEDEDEKLDRRDRELQGEMDAFGSPDFWDKLRKDTSAAGERIAASEKAKVAAGGAAMGFEPKRPEATPITALATASPTPPAASAPRSTASDVEDRIKRLAAAASGDAPPAREEVPAARSSTAQAPALHDLPFDDYAKPKARSTDELMKQSRAQDKAGFSGLGELSRMQAARREGGGETTVSNERRSKPIADFDTRLRRMAISAEKRGQRDLAETLSMQAGKFSTEEAFLEELNKSDNPLYEQQFGDIRDYVSFLSDEHRVKSKEEIEELRARDAKREHDAARKADFDAAQ